MVSLENIYHVCEETVPLYFAMILGYLSIKLWHLFTPEQCAGINKFVSKFSIPLLSFQIISTNNPYQMNTKLVISDALQKALAFFGFLIVTKVCCEKSMDWLITGISVSTLPNTLIVGIPLLRGMYGDEAVRLITQIVVLQSLVWYIILLIFFEYRYLKLISSEVATATQVTQVTDKERNSNSDISGELESGARQTREENPEEKVANKTAPKTTLSFMLNVGKKIAVNPNTYASLAGLVWSLISYRWGIKQPIIVNNSLRILSDGGLGMAMFSIGLFTASQSKIIACGARTAVLSLVLRFILGPSIMAISSYVVGMRGLLLKIAIVQAALPQGIVPFVFAKEYGVHPDILSTGIIVGMIAAVPIALAYYFLIGVI
ncbi:Auxin efflux carrier component [Rhynchospora pubera]|uniref:Auxin efflux carrier component n=1 Tax=Rhynchospora pubera TaxID=906938 RepID=A0AAV8DXJ8_9POAL|nr:Auxin efflux carrier component [Rhynchospora pubera]